MMAVVDDWMTGEFHKLARPLMRGVKLTITKPFDSSVKNRMLIDMLQDLPSFVGEIVVGPPEDPECRDRAEFLLAESDLIHPFLFWVYDMKTTNPYSLRDRLEIAQQMVDGACGPCVQFVKHELITNKQEMDAYIEKVVTLGKFPGIVLREPYSTFGAYDEEIPAESLSVAVN